MTGQRHRAPAGMRPGQPESSAWETLAFLAVLFAVGLFGWVVVAVLVWLLVVYTLVTVTVLLVGFVTTLALWLIVKGNRRARALAFGLLVGAAAFAVCVALL